MVDRKLRLAGLAGASGVAGSYAVAGYTRQFVVAPIDAAVVRATPGPVVAWAITNVGTEAHLLHVALATAIAIGTLGGIGVGGYLVSRRLTGRRQFAGGVLAGALVWGLTTALTAAPILALGSAVPVGLVTALEAAVAPSLEAGGTDSERRAALSSIGTLLFVGVAGGLGWASSRESERSADGPDEEAQSFDVSALRSQAESRELDFASEDLPGLVTPIGEFYNVDIAEFDPDLPPADWTLSFSGEIDRELTVSFEEIQERPTEHRFVTLRCVGESLNGEKLDTAIWTGTPLKPLLDEVDPDSACGCAMLRAEDDYFVQFPVDALEDGFLAWGMNGRPLPDAHGHPVRVLVPGHWGETNVKWLSEIELLREPADGYWEKRGWHGTGPVNTVAKLWDVTHLEDGRVEVGGHAYAGTRGIERVEVSTDGGATWETATVSERLPGDDVWRQWRHVYRPDGAHEVVVRAVDGDGTTQPRDRSEAFPSGATGWVSKEITP